MTDTDAGATGPDPVRRIRVAARQAAAIRAYVQGPRDQDGPLLSLWSLADADDPYGDASGWLFLCAELLHHDRFAGVPDEWEFRHGVGTDCLEGQDWPASEAAALYAQRRITADAARQLGNWLHARLSQMRDAGMER